MDAKLRHVQVSGNGTFDFWQCICVTCDFIGLAGYLIKRAYVYQTY